MSGVVDGTRWMGGVSNVWAENGGEVEAELQAMTTEGGVEIQRVRERERMASPSAFYKPRSFITFINDYKLGGHPEAMRRHPNRAL